MKVFALVFTPRAERQLADLYDYIAAQSGVARADDFVARIIDDCLALSSFPERGHKRDDIRPNLRVKGFLRRVMIAFSVDQVSDVVAIHGIFTVVGILKAFCEGRRKVEHFCARLGRVRRPSREVWP